MHNESPSAPPPASARPSSAGMIIVGVFAVAALALGAYAAFARKPAAANASSSHIEIFSADVEKRLTTFEQRLLALEQTRAASATSPAGDARAAAAPVGAPTPSPETAATIPSPSAPASRSDAGTSPFDIVLNADLKGRLGRLVVEFPQAHELKARTEVFKSGEAGGLRTDFGTFAAEMTAGAYDLNIGGAVVARVTIKSGHDTRVHVGVLRLNATGNTRFELFPPGETKSLGTYFGQTDVGLPVGTFEVEVNGQREHVTILSDSMTEY